MGSAAEQLTARLSRVATGSTPQQKSQWLQNQFSKWSVTRGDQGRLSLQQFKSALKSLNVKDEGGAEEVFTSLDSEGRGAVGVAELAASLTAAPPPRPAPAPPQQRRGGGRYPTEQHATSVAPLAAWPREDAVPRTPTGGPRTEGLGPDGTPIGRHVPMSQLVTRPDVWAVAEQKANQYNNMRKAFQWMDVNHSGQLSLEEMENACRLWNLPDPPAAAMAVFDSIDKNHDGKVSYNEFVNALARNRTMDHTSDKPTQATQFNHTVAPPRPMELPQADAKCVDIASGPNRTRGTPHGKRHLDMNRPAAASPAGTPPPGRADPPSPAVAFPPRGAAPPAAPTMPPGRPAQTASSPSEARPTQPPPLPPPAASVQVDISEAIVSRFRDCVLARGGPHGVHELGKSFLIMDSDRNHQLSPEELDNGLDRYGLHLSPKDLQMLMMALDKQETGTVTFNDFLLGVRGEISPGRQALIEMVFRVFDRTGDGVVTLEDLQNRYNVDYHPDVLNERMTADEALGHFLDQFDLRENDNVITLEEFTEYYRDVSASIDDDEYFEVMIRKAWGLPPANGATR